jgi:23S rRNA pseudouridine955/2504/2580 synthase
LFAKKRVSPEYEGARLDTWVRHHWPHIPYHSIQKAIRKKLIRITEPKSADITLKSNQEIHIHEKWLMRFVHSDISTEKTIPIFWKEKLESWFLYENEHFLVLNKPSGIACQGGSGQQVHLDRLLNQYGHQYRGETQMRLVHRLDKDTSGLFLVAKTLSCAQTLTLAFGERSIKKVYWAIVRGKMPENGEINFSLKKQGQRMIVSEEFDALCAHTAYMRKGYFPGYDQEHGPNSSYVGPKGYEWYDDYGDLSWAELYPHTGRMHQLRAHLQAIGHPIVGDKIYNFMMYGEKNNHRTKKDHDSNRPDNGNIHGKNHGTHKKKDTRGGAISAQCFRNFATENFSPPLSEYAESHSSHKLGNCCKKHPNGHSKEHQKSHPMDHWDDQSKKHQGQYPFSNFTPHASASSEEWVKNLTKNNKQETLLLHNRLISFTYQDRAYSIVAPVPDYFSPFIRQCHTPK